jgi:hypothetical protein
MMLGGSTTGAQILGSSIDQVKSAVPSETKERLDNAELRKKYRRIAGANAATVMVMLLKHLAANRALGVWVDRLAGQVFIFFADPVLQGRMFGTWIGEHKAVYEICSPSRLKLNAKVIQTAEIQSPTLIRVNHDWGTSFLQLIDEETLKETNCEGGLEHFFRRA